MLCEVQALYIYLILTSGSSRWLAFEIIFSNKQDRYDREIGRSKSISNLPGDPEKSTPLLGVLGWKVMFKNSKNNDIFGCKTKILTNFGHIWVDTSDGKAPVSNSAVSCLTRRFDFFLFALYFEHPVK